jgi:hypothetical protein
MRTLQIHRRVLTSVALIALLLPQQARAEDEGDGFSIAVDGEVVAGSQQLADKDRVADVALSDADIQVKFDGLEVRPMLNVATAKGEETYKAGEALEFRISTNYGAWITRADVIIAQNDGLRSGPVAEVAVDSNGNATWQVPDGLDAKLSYIVRVYDGEGRYDETQPLPLRPFEDFASKENKIEGLIDSGSVAPPGLNEDRTALRNIPIQGGAVTVFGRGLEKESEVIAFGERAPVDAEGNFLIQRILPPGDHTVDVEVHGKDNSALDFKRQINIPTSDWFYVGLADLTLGKRFGSKDIKAIYPGEYDGVYNKGRLAFYVKGKIRGSTILTAALDTGEHDVKNILKNMDEKDPRRFLKRIDPDDYYPVYGDDSTITEDAPTRGRFYVRLQRDDSHVMWGNFKAYVKGNKLLGNDRALYGAQGVYKSNTVAPDGGRRTEVSVHAAEPGTLSQNDILRGTGTSTYFTKHRDITQGSETVSVEVRDPVTGFVLSKTTLKAGTDYEFDYSQGVVILTNPLASSSGDKNVFLVINYEYSPATTEVKGYVLGGRAQQWVGDHIRAGVTAMRDYSGKSKLDMAGADVLLYGSDKTNLDLHVARSKGNGFGFSQSTDGGLTFNDVTPTTGSRKGANAYGFDLKADIGELTGDRMAGRVEAQYVYKQAGFSTLDSETTAKKEDIRIASAIDLTEKTDLISEGTQSKSAGKTDRELKVGVKHELTENTDVEVGVKHSIKSGASTAKNVGQRTDVYAKVTHDVDDDTQVYVFGQATVARKGSRPRDDRAGVGGKTAVSEKVDLEGEVSTGTAGMGAAAKVSYSPNDRAKYYLGYQLDPYRDLDTSSSLLNGSDNGKFIFGARQQVTDKLSFTIEDSYDMFGEKRTLAQTYGVDYAPFENWNLGATMEMGRIIDDNPSASDFDRKAGSVSVAYKNPNGNLGRVKAEARFDDSEDNTRDLESYLLEGTLSLKAWDDWRFLANLDAVYTDADSSAKNSRYLESSIGFAYRPVEDDRLNALFKYTYLYDVPGAEQVTVDGTLNGPKQQSHILAADFIYDVTEFLSVGAKYGVRYGETKSRTSDEWFKSSAHLGVIRADITVIDNWDAMIEGRYLYTPSAKSGKFGALAAVYRHIGENFKVGVGYNFGRFSDDMRDLVADDHGVFINAVGKF